MMNICTWIYCDEEHEESHYPQVGHKSSARKFQEVYWKCVANFFATSRRMNPDAVHILYTNTPRVPVVDGFDLERFLVDRLQVRIRVLPLTYRVPRGYFGAWKNQFYLFDIIRNATEEERDDDAQYLILDSDCIWVNPAEPIARLLDEHGLLTMTADVDDKPEFVMNGLSRYQMRDIYEEMLGAEVERVPYYFGGEWFAATAREMRNVIREIDWIWAACMERFSQNRPKFNEEAHMLSFAYYKLGYPERTANRIIKRMWTQLFGAHNASPSDLSLVVWHLPTEKKLGLSRLYEDVIRPGSPFWRSGDGYAYLTYLSRKLGVPRRGAVKLLLDIGDLVQHRMLRTYK